eukprot:TRINITY_DN210_c0_g1_i6.p1 TRINITY_DN210_c0_g1~~TRINITY_DN210_c0_g1_i6.p1  ORF type:complete len:509 (-),score=71.69 TRINITY_DN210_c0_g1_i6:469-1842(-)
MIFTVLISLMATFLFVDGFSYLVEDQVVKTTQEEAIAGSQAVLGSDLDGAQFSASLDVINNTAKSINAIANSGSRVVAGSGTTIRDGDFTTNSFASSNEATSNRNKAIGGVQLVLDNVQDTRLNRTVVSEYNEASVVGAETGNDYTAISGAQSLFGTVKNFTGYLTESAIGNTASNNYNGKAVAGVDQAFGFIEDTYIRQQNDARDNFAVAGDGRAVSGVQTGASEVVDSTIVNFGSASNTQAKAINGNAVAGVENNFGTLNGTFPGGSATVVLGTTSFGNIASARDGKAIAGVATNVQEMYRSSLVQLAESENNKAVTFGEGEIPKQSVAGVNVVINDVEQSTVALNLSSNGNQAFNYHQDPLNASDAVAGTKVTIGSADRAVIDVLATSTNNYAMAKYGDAIAGNQLEVLNSTSDTIVSVDLEAYNNSAVADNGDAIIDNSINIQGGAATIPPGL